MEMLFFFRFSNTFTDLSGFSYYVMNPGFQAFITYVTFSPVNASGIINGPLKLMTSINGNPLFQSKTGSKTRRFLLESNPRLLNT